LRLVGSQTPERMAIRFVEGVWLLPDGTSIAALLFPLCPPLQGQGSSGTATPNRGWAVPGLRTCRMRSAGLGSTVVLFPLVYPLSIENPAAMPDFLFSRNDQDTAHPPWVLPCLYRVGMSPGGSCGSPSSHHAPNWRPLTPGRRRHWLGSKRSFRLNSKCP
jgi:hypothetical protein